MAEDADKNAPVAQKRPKAPKPQVVGAKVSASKPKPKAASKSALGAAPKAAAGGAPKAGTGAGAKVKYRVNAVKAVSAQDREADKQSMGQVHKSLVFLGIVTLAYLAYLIFSGQMDVFLSKIGRAHV